MREIQDLTLQVERGLAGIERQFQEQRERFARRFAAYRGRNMHAIGLRATLVPVTPIYLDRVHGNDAATPPSHTLYGTIGDYSYPLSLGAGSADWRPVVRGTVTRANDSELSTGSREVRCDSLIEYIRMLQEAEGSRDHSQFFVPVQWVISVRLKSSVERLAHRVWSTAWRSKSSAHWICR